MLPTIPMLMLGCALLNPEATEATNYVNELQPLLHENGLLGEQVLLIAAAEYNQKPPKDGFDKQWRTTVVPLAEHLQHQAAALDTEGVWEARHEVLVDIWGERAVAYRGMSEALLQADEQAWTTSRDRAQKAMLDQEKWFQETNQQLAAFGLSVDPWL